MQQEQAVIIGAGPCGLSAAIELQKAGLPSLIIEKEMIVSSIYRYPTYMHFFSTPELLEIGDVPFTTPNEKPTRNEALHYYRNVAVKYGLRIHAYEEVTGADEQDGEYVIRSLTRNGEQRAYRAPYVIIATGYFDNPNLLGIPGEELPKVSHFFREAHPYTGMRVAIIGGNNSAIDAALELQRVGAKVTVVYRKEMFSPNIKPWVLPVFESMVRKGAIDMLFNSMVSAITPDTVRVASPEGELALANDFVLALTGFRPNRAFLTALGADMDEETGKPRYNEDTMETNRKGLYVAGVVASGRDANEVFIETGRQHGKRIAEHVKRSREGGDAGAGRG